MSDTPTDTVHRQRSNLADLHPRPFGEAGRLALEGEGKPSARLLTRHRYRNDGPGSLVEDVVAENEDGALTCLFATPNRIEVSPANLAS